MNYGVCDFCSRGISATKGVKKRTRSSSKTPTITSSATDKTKTAPMGLFPPAQSSQPLAPRTFKRSRAPASASVYGQAPYEGEPSAEHAASPFSLSVRSQPILTLSQEASAQEPTATRKTSAAKKFWDFTFAAFIDIRATNFSFEGPGYRWPPFKREPPSATQLQLWSAGRLLLKGSHPLATQLHPFSASGLSLPTSALGQVAKDSRGRGW